MNNTSNVSFKGAFLIKYPKTVTGLREGFEKVIEGKGKLVYDNFDENKVLYVMKHSKDYAAADFIKKNSLRFEYIPDMDTRVGIIPCKPESAKQYIEEKKPVVIKKLAEMMKFIEENRTENRAVKQVPKVDLHGNIMKNLMINVSGNRNRDSRGVVIIRDKANDGVVKFSPASKNNITYVYVKPSNQYEEPMRYAVDFEGNLLMTFKTPEAIKKFYEGFNNAIKHYKGLE